MNIPKNVITIFFVCLALECLCLVFLILINPFFTISYDIYDIDKYHSFFKNPKFQIRETIENILIENAMKVIKEKGISDGEE